MISLNDMALNVVCATTEVVTEADKIELQWFQPWHYFLYLAVILGMMILYYQWKWERTVKKNALVLVQRSDGTPYSILVPKKEGSIDLFDPITGQHKTWPVNNNSFMDVLYPSFGFLPQFLLKKIKMTIVSEKDWEPLLNLDPEGKMIASPLVLGSLIHEQFTAMIATVTQDTMDKLQGLVSKMENVVDKTTFYIGIGLVAIAVVALFVIVLSGGDSSNVDDVMVELDKVKQALGIVETIPTPDVAP